MKVMIGDLEYTFQLHKLMEGSKSTICNILVGCPKGSISLSCTTCPFGKNNLPKKYQYQRTAKEIKEFFLKLQDKTLYSVDLKDIGINTGLNTLEPTIEEVKYLIKELQKYV